VAIGLLVLAVAYLRPGFDDGGEPPPTRRTDVDAPDPAVLAADDSYWLFSTSADGHRLPIRGATVFGMWGGSTEGLARRPGWAAQNEVWGPSVIEADGRYVLWFASPTGVSVHSMCIGPAVSDTPGGPYEPLGDEPAICSPSGAAIDPHPWRSSDGRLFLAWTQYHIESGGSDIRAAALDESGTELAGQPRRLLAGREGWEDAVLENPAMFEDDGSIRLLYSGNRWYTADYATGTATCERPLGPCRRDTPRSPWHAGGRRLNGPGGMELFTDHAGETWAVFHAWDDRVGYPAGGRRAPHVVPLSDLPPLPPPQG
jgi:beta-xylosidase